MCSHDLPTTCEKFYHEIPTTMFTISFFSPITMNDICSQIKAIAERKA